MPPGMVEKRGPVTRSIRPKDKVLSISSTASLLFRHTFPEEQGRKTGSRFDWRTSGQVASASL